MNQKKYRPGEIIFWAGQPGSTMFETVKGEVGIYSDFGLPSEKLLNKVKLFGEMSLLDGAPRSATAVALDQTTLNEISLNDFIGFLHDRPSKMELILKNMSASMQRLSENYISACETLTEAVDLSQRGEALSGGLVEALDRLTGEYHQVVYNSELAKYFGVDPLPKEP